MSNELQLGLFDAISEPENTEQQAPHLKTETPKATIVSEGYSPEFAQTAQVSLSEGLSNLIAHGELIPSFGSVNHKGVIEGAIFYVSKREFEEEMRHETFNDMKHFQETYIPIEAIIEDNNFKIVADGLYDTLGDERFTKALLSACKIVDGTEISITHPDFDSLKTTVETNVEEYKEVLKREREERNAKNSKNDEHISPISA